MLNLTAFFFINLVLLLGVTGAILGAADARGLLYGDTAEARFV